MQPADPKDFTMHPTYRSSSTGKPALFYDTDTPAMIEAIEKLRELKYFIRRGDRITLKLGRVNFWPSTGTITIDGEGRYDGGQGLDDLLALLAERFPPHISYTPKRAPASQKLRLVPSTPPADLPTSAHFSAIFDDEESDETPS
jgi:hypothetical protein